MKYKSNIKQFVSSYISSSWDIKNVLEKIYSDIDEHSFYQSSDTQLFDVSYELRDDKRNKDELRFSYFWTKFSFLEKFSEFHFSIELLTQEYARYKEILKDDFITVSFVFQKCILQNIKVYFDIFWENQEIQLIAFSMNTQWVFESKVYYPYTQKNYIKSLIYLKNNHDFKERKIYQPFDILYRKIAWGLESIKYYYQKTPLNKKLFLEICDTYFSDIVISNIDLHIQEELGIDYDVNQGIKKIDYYIWLYK